MATWTTIPDSSLEPGKPIRSIDALALRDNPIAIAEAASGAPSIVLAAIQGALGNRVHAEIGTVAVAYNSTTTNYASNATIAGSSLRYWSSFGSMAETNHQFTTVTDTSSTFPTFFNTALTGTWRNLGGYCRGRLTVSGEVTRYYWFPSIWLRIA